jgi:hypothetical protein
MSTGAACTFDSTARPPNFGKLVHFLLHCDKNMNILHNWACRGCFDGADVAMEAAFA